jgi:diphthamide biosynthesis protein 2
VQQQDKQQQQQQPGCCTTGAAPQCDAPYAGSHPVAISSSGSSSSGVSEGHHTLAGYQWQLPAGMGPQDCGLAWVGAPDAPALLQLQLTYSGCQWAVLDPSLLPPATSTDSGSSSCGNPDGCPPAFDSSSLGGALSEGLPLEISRALRRRYYLVERARDASIVGILLGTLGAAGYADAADRLRAAAAAAGKKTYTLLMGKPSPAKLANFPEIEVGWAAVLLRCC